MSNIKTSAKMEGKVETKDAVNVYAGPLVEVWPSIKPPTYFPWKKSHTKPKALMPSKKLKKPRAIYVDHDSWDVDSSYQEPSF